MMKTYLGGEEEALDGFEFLSMAEAGELCHWEIVEKMAGTLGDQQVAELAQWAVAAARTSRPFATPPRRSPPTSEMRWPAAVPAGRSTPAPEHLDRLARGARRDVVRLARQPPPQHGQRRQAEQRRDREQQAAVGDHRDGGVARVDAVDDERADQAAVDAADPARDRDQPPSWPMM